MSFREDKQTTYMDQMVRVKNTTDQIFSAKWGGEDFAINPNSEEEVPMWLGRHLLRHGSVDGKPVIELIEDVKVTCGVCQKAFDTKRELGAHSLTHRPKASASKE